jgi:uncharacterized protein (TIGR00369 family)
MSNDLPKTPEERREGLKVLFNDKAPIAGLFGMRAWYEDETAIFELPYNPGLNHALGATHGGVIATLLDNAGWFTAAPFFDTWIATVEFHVRLHEPVTGQTLRSRAKLIRRGKRLTVAEMEVRGEQGQLVATGSGTFAVTSAPMDWSALRAGAPHR